MNYTNYIIIALISIVIVSCSKKTTTYYGKIIDKNDLTNLSLKNKQELINKFGPPTYIDPIEQKFFYYSEIRQKINIFNKKTNYSYLFVFEFNNDELIINQKVYDLLKTEKIDIVNDITDSEIIKRGLIQKIFGGVGNESQLPTN